MSAAGAPPAGGVDVLVRSGAAGEPVPVRGAYVALVPLDDAPSRPAVETIADGRAQWSDVAPGPYGLVVEAASFDPVFRRVEISSGKRNEVTVDLEPQLEITGTVVDVSGAPVQGAAVCHPRVVTAAILNNMSRLARRNASTQLCARTDANGWWKLAAPAGHQSELLVQAAGYEPVWVTREASASEVPEIKLRKGASLRARTNRAAPDLVLSLVPSTRIESSIPTWAQRSIWVRDVDTTAVEWSSLLPGEYDLIATWPDPRRFSAPVTLRRLTVRPNASDEIELTLPDDPPLQAKTARLVVSPKTEIANLRAFVRTDSGVKEVRAASEVAPRGRVLYADVDAAPADVFFTTETELILPSPRGDSDSGAVQRAALAGMKFPKAEGKLRVSVAAGGTLPSRGTAEFSGCAKDERFVLPVGVGKGGEVAVPLLVGCSGVTFRFDAFSPVAVAARARAREEVWLGAHTLTAPASAEIHVVQQPGGAHVDEAIVTAAVERAPGEFVTVVRRIAGPDGRLVLEGLPAGEAITFRAEERATKLAASVTRTIAPGDRAIIDPLPLPRAAELTVIPRFDEEFRQRHPEVEIIGVFAEGEGSEKRSVQFTETQREAVFLGLTPGTWRMLAMMRMAGATQPVDIATVTLEPGDTKKIEPVVRPLVLSGRVTSRGRGVATSLAITDPPGPRAITRRVFSKADGSFHSILPRPGVYAVSARRTLKDPDVELEPIHFDGSSDDVQIALPEGSLSVRVVANGAGDAAVADAELTASMLIDVPQRGFSRLERKERTGALGDALLDEMQEGTWLVTARAKDGNVAEKTVVVTKDRAASVTLNLERLVVEGVVVNAAGLPAGSAAVDCLYSGSGNIPRTVRGETDSWGKFSIPVARPAPARILCGVTTADGAIGTFVTTVRSDVRFALPPATSAVTITNWSDYGNRDRFWLVASDGGLFDLSWAARKLRRQDAPMTIAKVPAGGWSVVRVDSPAAFDALARGAAEALPRVAQVRIPPGQNQEIDLKHAVSFAPR